MKFSHAAFSTFLGCAIAIGCGTSSSSSTVSAISVTPDPCAVGRTDSTQMKAEATLPDGTKEDITDNPETIWTTDNSQTATVDATGVVVGVNAGSTKIHADFQGATGGVDCTVGP